MNTRETIIQSSIPILARQGYAGTSMRKVARHFNREPSIIYAHFTDKESLLRETRRYINQKLDSDIQVSNTQSAPMMLRQTIRFQFENRELIMALLQYFMACRQDFDHVQTGGYVPESAYQHLHAIIQQGVAEGVYASNDVQKDAKAASHLINGYLIEYFDHEMTDLELDTVVSQITDFIERSLQCEVVPA